MPAGSIAILLIAFTPGLLPPGSLIQQSDSQHVLASARAAQTAFERLRTHHLPRTLDGTRSPPDAVFGRMRYWDEEDGVIRQRPPESDRVIEARRSLVARLDSAAGLIPGDRWVIGQRVRYLVDGGNLEEAQRVATECRAETWWCDALLAFVTHLQADFAVADSLFASSLERMPSEKRCIWTDMREVLDPDLAQSYRQVPCVQRDSLNDRIFWLADPLYALPGNDRRTEHYARHVVHEMFDGTRTPLSNPWGDDNLALVRRYGWAETWEQTQASQFGAVSVIGHNRRRGEHFIPSKTFFESPASIGWHDWPLDVGRARERYAPRYADSFEEIQPQVATFRRANGVLVVAAFDVPTRTRHRATGAESGAPARPTDAIVALAASQDERSGMLIHRQTVDAEARLALQIPAVPVVLGIEALNGRDSIAARRRYWLNTPQAPPDSFGVSDLLLCDAADGQLPRTIEEALPRARTTATFTRGDSIHIYWEVYGPAPGEPYSVKVVVTKEGKSLLRRAVEWIGLAERDNPPIRLEWVDVPDVRARGPGRAVTLQLPQDEQGRFTIKLELTNGDGGRVEAEREITVEASGDE